MKKVITLLFLTLLLALGGCVIEEKDCDTPGGSGSRGDDDDSYTPIGDDDDDSSSGGSGLCWDFAILFSDCATRSLSSVPDGTYEIAEKSCLDGLAALETQRDRDVVICGLECEIEYGECIPIGNGAYGHLYPDGSCPWCNDLLK